MANFMSLNDRGIADGWLGGLQKAHGPRLALGPARPHVLTLKPSPIQTGFKKRQDVSLILGPAQFMGFFLASFSIAGPLVLLEIALAW